MIPARYTGTLCVGVPVAEDVVPTYQYACTACGHRFEAVQSFSDASLTDCPECAGRLRKVFSSVGIVFKGSGFYRTDSREKSPSGAGKPGDGSAGSGKDSGSADSGAKDSGGTTKDAGKKKELARASGSKGSGTSSSTSSTPVAAAS
jgi:putative FmdB family regulatory protein